MNGTITRVLVCFAVIVLSGCVLLPIPHDEWLSPRFYGTVLDDKTGRPLAGVKVTLWGYRYAEDELGDVVVYTDAKGSFSVLAARHTTWLPIWLAPAEGIQEGTVLFEFAAYESVETKRQTFTGASSRTEFKLNIRMKKNTGKPSA
jgi:hypothetical protein